MFEIHSIADYIDVLLRFRHEGITHNPKDCVYYYRGEPEDYKETSGTPSIKRFGLEKETSLFRECERRLPEEFARCKSTFEKLALMQHYMIPTRLLDITPDSLQALFFALYHDPAFEGPNPNDNKDAVILVYEVLKNEIKDYHSDAVSVVANIALYPSSKGSLDISHFHCSYHDRADFNKSEHWEIHHLLHEIKAEKPHFVDWINKDDMESVFCVHPLLDNPRIRSQQGLFLLFGIDGNRNKLATIESSKSTHIKMQKIVIPAKAKPQIREELMVLGKSIDTVYPDWNGVRDYLKRFWEKEPREYYK
ncbi:MAG: FRG domain-containing protein [Fibrobacter sp.]|nr:FRG domain-containing protein [Fibrobacter sp.]